MALGSSGMANANGITGHSKLDELVKKCITEPILQQSLSKGSNAGDNVIGKMLSVQVSTASGKTHDLIIKSLIPFNATDVSTGERFFARVISVLKVFETELAYYDRIQPEMEKLLQHSLPTPKYYFGQCDAENDGQDSCLVLEDLRPQGFKMADKITGLTLAEVRMVLEKLAKFHAASFVYLKKTKILENIRNSQKAGSEISVDPLTVHVFARSDGFDKNVHKNYLNSIYFGMMDVMKETNQLAPETLDKILNSCRDPQGFILQCSKDSIEKYFPVINHGDLWVNNMLFKYGENGTPEDVKFIDFQQCRYASVFDELHYFIYTSTSAKFRKDHLKDCLNFYYDTFTAMLKDTLDFPGPEGFTRESFFEGYHEFLGGAFGYAVIAVPFQVGVPPNQDPEGGSDIWKTDENESKTNANNETNGEIDPNQELIEGIKNIFSQSAISLKSAALNSPIAIKRLKDLCLEMDDLDIFKLLAPY